MKTNTTTSSTTNNEITLGWKSMPAYGEVMPQIVGTFHTDVQSSMNLDKKNVLKSFWSTLSNVK